MRSHPAAAARTVSLIRRIQPEPDETRHGRAGSYCYGVWLRHLNRLAACGMSAVPEAIVELGPGDTVGVGVAGLLSGCERLRALDTQRYLSVDATLDVVADLVELYDRRAPVPDAEALPEVRPILPTYAFPDSILTDDLLRASLAPSRVDAIRHAVAALRQVDPVSSGPQSPELAEPERGPSITYAAPWAGDAIEPASVDLVLSQAVMEHVADIEATYLALARWLVPGGWMSHQIDFRSHGTSFDWNGHWTYEEKAWALVANAKAFRWINREPLSTHVAAAGAAGLEVEMVQTVPNLDGAPRSAFAARFADMSESDATCQGALLVARRPQ